MAVPLVLVPQEHVPASVEPERKHDMKKAIMFAAAALMAAVADAVDLRYDRTNTQELSIFERVGRYSLQILFIFFPSLI